MIAILDPIEPIRRELGIVLLHFLWQGAAVAALLAMVMRFMHRRSPNERYAVCGLGLLAMAAAPPLTLFYLHAAPPGDLPLYLQPPSIRIATVSY